MKSTTRRPLVFSLALAAVLALGVSTLWMLAAGWVGSIVQQLFGARGANEQLVFTAEGKPLVQTSDYIRDTTVLRTVDGQLVEDVGKTEILYGSNWLWTPKFAFRRGRSADISWTQRVIGFIESGGVPNFWYLVTDDGNPVHGYLEGFDAKTGTKIGYIGLAGYRTDEPPWDERFEIDGRALGMWWGTFAGQYGNQGREPQNFGWSSGQPYEVFLNCLGKLYLVDLHRRTVELIPVHGQVLSIANVSKPVRVPDQPELISKRRILARIEGQLLIMDETGAVLQNVPLPEGTGDRMLEIFLTLGDETILVAFPDTRHEMTDVYWMNGAGQVTKSDSLRVAFGYFTVHEEPIWRTPVNLPAPLPLAYFWLNAPRVAVESGQFADYPTALAHLLRNGWPWLLGVAGLSAILAMAAFRRQVRLAQPHPAIWAFFVFLLGPAGYIGYLVHRTWPAMSRCARCGATVPQDRLECAACAAEFALPARRGIEIFA